MKMISGTIRNTVKLQELTNKWQQKKNSGNALSKRERNERENWTKDQWLIEHFKEENEANKEKSKHNGISNKIMSGGTLTPEEELYLQQNAPEQLKEYREMKAEKHAYKEKLRRCKTKEEVNKLKTNTVNGFLSELKSVVNNPNIPLSAKLATAKKLLAKTRNIQDAEKSFIQSGEYGKLPTEEEVKEENQEKVDRTETNKCEKADKTESENTEKQNAIEDTEALKIINELEEICNTYTSHRKTEQDSFDISGIDVSI